MWLNKACKEDIETKDRKITARIEDESSNMNIWPCGGFGAWSCNSATNCCGYYSSCCNVRQNLIRSNYGNGAQYANALACELEKVLNGCIPQGINQNCFYSDVFCLDWNGVMYADINALFGIPTQPFSYCSFNTSTSPYICGGIQYNVDINIVLQDLMASKIRLEALNTGPTCPTGYTKIITEYKINLCTLNGSNCVEYPDCFNLLVTVECKMACCSNSSI